MPGGPMTGPPSGSFPPQYGAYPGSFGAPPAQDPMWGYFIAIAGQDGEVDAEELQRCLTQTGISGTYARYRVSPQALGCIIKRFSRGGRIYFDDYVACCVKLRALTENFRMRDVMQQGTVNFRYDDVSSLDC
ncbi:Grancalcin [Bagarius yarrelli]|uniref:Grancalcin n=1 Tax=Bagarius yarrelli TaxID=175774 RepID=A0A556TT93_BAGYA|nr:Grancalcin [Bagarius yarrelli]